MVLLIISVLSYEPCFKKCCVPWKCNQLESNDSTPLSSPQKLPWANRSRNFPKTSLLNGI